MGEFLGVDQVDQVRVVESAQELDCVFGVVGVVGGDDAAHEGRQGGGRLVGEGGEGVVLGHVDESELRLFHQETRDNDLLKVTRNLRLPQPLLPSPSSTMYQSPEVDRKLHHHLYQYLSHPSLQIPQSPMSQHPLISPFPFDFEP